MEKNSQPWVAIAVPSRGLIFTELLEYIEAVRSTYPNIRVFYTHNLPIPDCFNYLAEEILQDKKYEYIWWIEEDTIPQPLALDKFLVAMESCDIAAQNYGFNNGWGTVGRNPEGKILFTGFGCTFMKREVLEALEKPIFKVDKSFNISILQWYANTDLSKIYGQYDIRFGSEARKKGFTIEQIEGEGRHLQLIALGQKETNHGCHQIAEKGKMERELIISIADL